MKNVLRLFTVFLAVGALTQSVYAYRSDFLTASAEQVVVKDLVEQAGNADTMTDTERSELNTQLAQHMIKLIELLGGSQELQNELLKKGWLKFGKNTIRKDPTV